MIDDLKQRGLTNPYRVRALIEDAIDFNKFDDLTELVVFTEAASKNYVTPINSIIGRN